MDPGTILSIIQVSTSTLKTAKRLYDEFRGDDRSVDRLKQLNGRLQALNETLSDILQESKAAGGSVVGASGEPFRGTHSLQKTLEDCREFLGQYEKALTRSGARAAVQRVGFIVGTNDARLEKFHERIDRHYLELQHWNSRVMTRRLGILMETRGGSISEPDMRAPSSASLTPDPRPPARTFTGESSDTLVDGYHGAAYHSTRASHSPVLHPLSRTSSLASIPEMASPMSGSSRGDYRLSADSVSTRSSVGNGAPSTVATLLGIHQAPHTPPNHAPSAAGGAMYATPGIPSSPILTSDTHYMKLILGTRIWTFGPESCMVSEVDGVKIIEWNSPTTKIRHIIPRGLARIPHTKPNDKKFEIMFLPMNAKHDFEITENQQVYTLQEKPRYQFSHKPDREVFQRKYRSRRGLEMIQALTIHSEKEKYIAQDIHLKVWRKDELDEEPTFSFVHHEKGQTTRHVEYKIRWFRRTPELKGDRRLIMRAYSQESDLDYGPRNEEGIKKGSTFLRRMSRESSKSRSPSNSSLVTMLYERDVRGITPPSDVQRLGYLDIEFRTSKLRENFLIACHFGTPLSRRGTAIIDTPQIVTPSSRPPSISLPPPLVPTPDTSPKVYGSPKFTTPRYFTAEHIGPAEVIDPADISPIDAELVAPAELIGPPTTYSPPNPTTFITGDMLSPGLKRRTTHDGDPYTGYRTGPSHLRQL